MFKYLQPFRHYKPIITSQYREQTCLCSLALSTAKKTKNIYINFLRASVVSITGESRQASNLVIKC